MAAMNLRSTIESLATEFAAGVLAALRSASLEDVLAQSQSQPIQTAKRLSTRASKGKSGDPNATINAIVATLRSANEGLRAEQIRGQLGIDKATVTKALTQALVSKVVTKQGEKRATRYFAA